MHLLLPTLIQLFKVDASIDIRCAAIKTLIRLIPRVQHTKVNLTAYYGGYYDPLSDMENDPYEDAHKQPKVHQAPMYPLLVACKSISNLTKAAAQEVDGKVRQYNGLLVDQPDTLLQIQKEDGTDKEYPLVAAIESTKNTLIQDSIKLLLDLHVVLDQELGMILKLRDMMIGWIHEGFQSFFRQLNDELMKQEGSPL
ncbi:unnamed protein product [Lactuca saligna]|uniref:Uncharacterized protein n=1 Tax=Lactuca saligna TaxID=75948 RepID=A0AA35ZJM2_LACSI|nr:unnamed protein product [Lactuca saligna]